jgi:hypothetical protein
LEVARDCRRLSEGGPDVAVTEGSPRQSRRSEVGLNVAVIKYSPRKSQVDATAIQGAIRESHRAEGGLAVVTNRGATVRSHRHSEGGIDIASRQARDKQAQYLNAQQAHLECEIGKEFLSGYHAKQNYDDLSDLAPVEVTNPGIQPVIVDEMQRLLSISGSANLQHRLQSLCREFSDIFLSTVRELPAVVPPLSMSVNRDRWADRRNRLPPPFLTRDKDADLRKQITSLESLGVVERSTAS